MHLIDGIMRQNRIPVRQRIEITKQMINNQQLIENHECRVRHRSAPELRTLGPAPALLGSRLFSLLFPAGPGNFTGLEGPVSRRQKC
ncbi:MAG: hypothetical protein DRH32_05830 [Deltaproteobacteria bacterium]|nr:MAG: hypothetical protein DRH32_05830 [Deltaproteobacteria bacterium]